MRCYSHLSDDEREQIGLAKAVGHSIGAIAKAIGRPKSTVSHKLRDEIGGAIILTSQQIECFFTEILKITKCIRSEQMTILPF